MAARTLTYTINMAATPKAVHAGLNQIAFDFNSGTTKLGTLSDMVLLGKIPSGALITSRGVNLGINGSGASVHWQLQLLAVDALGTLSAIANIINSMTSSANGANLTSNVSPYKLSLSDDRAVQYAVLALNCSTGATETVSVSFQGVVSYLMDGSNV